MAVRPSTLSWVGRQLEFGERVMATEELHGGITAEMQKLTIGTSDGGTRQLVLRSYVDPVSLRHAADWLDRETYALKAFANTGLPIPRLAAVDSDAVHCEYPSLLMTHMPGRMVLSDKGLESRIVLLARQLVAIHALRTMDRPRDYQSLTTADTVVIPARADMDIWAAAIDVITKPAPPYDGRILHRDFQPGNILFDLGDTGSCARITGVVDWAGTSWGPSDLDVAHCSTNLALLHGPEWGLGFAAAYEEAGGVVAATEEERLYWQVRDPLACSEEVQLWAQPWREAGRTDLTSEAVEDRLNAYVSSVMSGRV